MPQPLRLGLRGERAVPHRRGDADSQRVKTTEAGGPPGYDAAKKVNGRKRHALVDADGRGSLLRVSSADVQDRDGAVPLLRTSRGAGSRLARVFADTAYAPRESPTLPASEFRTAEIQDPLPGMKLGVAVATATGLALLIALLVYNGVCFQLQNERATELV